MPANYQVAEHQHPWGQLAYASRGIMKVEVPGASFIIPPQRALWVPPFTPHIVSTRFGLSFRSLYIDNEWAAKLPQRTTSIDVSDLLRELILEVTRWAESYSLCQQTARFLAVLIDQIRVATSAPLFLKMPSDKRLRQIVQRLQNCPADKTSLNVWSKTIGATPRTLNRLFQKETQMGFIEWRQRLRILYSLEKIERGEKISSVALDLGYDSGSAFTTMFKKHLGVSPKTYFKSVSNDSAPVNRSTPDMSL